MGKYQQWVQLTMIVNEQKNKKKQLQQQLKHQNLPTDILSCSSMDYFLLEISLFDDEHTGKVLSVFVSRAQRDSNISLFIQAITREFSNGSVQYSSSCYFNPTPSQNSQYSGQERERERERESVCMLVESRF